MTFKRRTQVEFTATVPCQVLMPEKYSPKVVRVPEGTPGETYDHTDIGVLPGDVPVLINLDVPGDGPQNLLVSAREGVLAEVLYETDPENLRVAFKHFRGLTVKQ